MAHVTAFPFVEIGGSPIERGRSYGEQARDRIDLSVQLYAGQLGKYGFGASDIDRLAGAFLPKLQDWAPDLVEEMEGIADGANVAFSEIVMINARTEMLQLARREKGIVDDEPDGCTGAVILPEAAAGGRLIHGQNWDWRAECVDTSVVVAIKRADGPDLLTFTEAGGLARSGFNSAGIAITANYLESDRDYRDIGIPLPFIRRRALEAKHFAHAVRVVATTPKSGSNNMMLSTAEGFAIDLECAPDETFTIYPENGLIVHANHWQSPVALAKLRETGLPEVPDSVYRDYRVRQHLERRVGALGLDALKQALFDDFGDPLGVCRPPFARAGGNLSATVAMIVFETATGVMEVAPLPAQCREFTHYRISMDEELLARIERSAIRDQRTPARPTEKRWAASS